ncbi:flagellar basal body rod protein FlgC [Coralloluteibacterium stylophorae]|uniref:Flagellar basal-body rod protein FlgC n=1 Tax=Coralloluteibacterium stylophorae TaxID=1776034 RepID=A0A8J7VTI4_9GAMM|nr:flagellar basal body rod protein FlgC [Coralloluteibacterium stylophorae]MBS7457195.1 flagellar basal body rod protein FlgC [Coralloluteibacterium stylophorae]
MSSLPIFDVAGSAMAAQSLRLNTIASNLANAESVASTAEGAYKARQPLFSAVVDPTRPDLTGVQVTRVQESRAEAVKRYEPGHPLADADGYVYAPDIDPVGQMVDLISASRGYQAGVEVLNTAKELALATLNLGK